MRFSSKKLTGLGFEFKYSVEDMFDSAVQACLEKQLLPLQTVEPQQQQQKQKTVAPEASGQRGKELNGQMILLA